MIGLEDRQNLARDIEAACAAGARLEAACEIAGISARSLQRWKAHQGLVKGDGRPQAVRPVPDHALTPAEREQILCVANEPRFADMPPARIVPMLADEGRYIASESSFQRVLRAHGQNRHRGRAQGSCPSAWCKSTARKGRDARGSQRGTADSRGCAVSLRDCRPSSCMYRRCRVHSSFCSSKMAPTRRVTARSLGKMPTTSVRRLILQRSGAPAGW